MMVMSSKFKKFARIACGVALLVAAPVSSYFIARNKVEPGWIAMATGYVFMIPGIVLITRGMNRVPKSQPLPPEADGPIS